uniref:Protein sleepless n=1 Tax=Dendroctonus ponderosae TaxID=77166 RepID=A0AAR5QIM5_DENPD
MDKFVLYIFVFGLGGVAQSGKNTTSWLQCYQCDPTTHSSSACAKPLKNVGLLNCSVPNGYNWRISCFSTFLNYSNATNQGSSYNRTGIRRGCSFYPSTNANNSYCNSNPGTNVSRVSCKVCESSACNTHIFNSKGNITGSGGDGNGVDESKKGIDAGGGSGGGETAGVPFSKCLVVMAILVLSFKTFNDL